MNTLNISRKDKYAICQIDHGKVNAIDTELSLDLDSFFREAEEDDSIEGLILSGRPHCFSAGLDVMKLAMGGMKKLDGFWRAHLKALRTMICFSKPYIAAITGYAPAAGTTLACTAEYRIMGRGEKHVMGMHERQLSLVIPDMFAQIFSHWIGDNKAMECFLHSRLMQADEVQSIGLVNEACEVEEVLPRAEALMQHWTQAYMKANQKSKAFFKQGLIKKTDLDMDTMIAQIMESSSDPVTHRKFAEFMMSVKKKKQ